MLLNCNHVFCQYCLNQWKRNKRECPVCRTQITSESRFPFIDNAIESMISQLSEESQIKRKELVSQRAELVKRQVAEAVVEAANRRAAADHTHYVAQINAAAAPRLPHVPITVGTTSTRGGRRTARRPDPVLPAQPTYIMNPGTRSLHCFTYPAGLIYLTCLFSSCSTETSCCSYSRCSYCCCVGGFGNCSRSCWYHTGHGHCSSTSRSPCSQGSKSAPNAEPGIPSWTCCKRSVCRRFSSTACLV